MIKCLHGEPAAYSTTQNGSFWFCNQSPSNHFFCSKNEEYLTEKAIESWKSTKQSSMWWSSKAGEIACDKKLIETYLWPTLLPVFRSIESLFLLGLGRCATYRKTRRSSWTPCVIRKVKKEGLNKDRLFFCCPNDKENSFRFFEWAPDEATYAHYRSVNFFKPQLEKPSSEKPTEHYLTIEFINDFANNLAI